MVPNFFGRHTKLRSYANNCTRSHRRHQYQRPHVEPLEMRCMFAGFAPPDGLISWWEANGAARDAAGDNGGAILLGAGFASGQVGQAFNFDGVDDRVQVPDADNLKLTGSLTIEAWVQVDSLPVNRAHGHVLFRGDDRNGLDPYYLAVSREGTLKFNIDSLTAKARLEAPVPSIAQFFHVAATLDDTSGSMRIYVNGALAAEMVTDVRPFRDLDPAFNPGVAIGNHGGYPGTPHSYPLDGQIDELSIYSRALATEEIQAIYNAGLDGHGKIAISITDTSGGEAGSSVTFTVSLSSPSDAHVTVNHTTADGTANAAVDYVAGLGTLTFAPGEISHTIVVQMLDDADIEQTETFSLVLSDAVGAGIADSTGIATIIDNELPPTKFYVVNDATTRLARTSMRATGTAIENYALNSGNTAPRGAASTAAGDKTWVVDANKKVYVYNTSGALLGSWTAGRLASNAHGRRDCHQRHRRLDRRCQAATRSTATPAPPAASRAARTPPAALHSNSGNTSPKDIVTDGVHLWVVNDSTTDKVFKYTLSGSLVGSWTITAGGGSPTGITIDPANVSDIWIVDNGTDRVYQYTAAASRTSGSQSPATSFALAAGNTNPQGIADPPAGLRRRAHDE